MGTLQSLAFPEQRERGFRVRRPSTLGCPPVIRTGARSIAGDGVSHYKNYILASLQRKVPYPLQVASMDASIRAFYEALRSGATPPMSVAEGSAVVHACELAVAPLIGMPEMPDCPEV